MLKVDYFEPFSYTPPQKKSGCFFLEVVILKELYYVLKIKLLQKAPTTVEWILILRYELTIDSFVKRLIFYLPTNSSFDFRKNHDSATLPPS